MPEAGPFDTCRGAGAPGIPVCVIAHAGGEVAGVHYSNSVEAVEGSLAKGRKAIELDVVPCRDGFIFAHDGMEGHYGLTSFLEVTQDAFVREHRFQQVYTPVSLDYLVATAARHPALRFVLDAKCRSLLEYSRLLDVLVERGLSSAVIPQAYRYEDVVACLAKGFRHAIFATWKQYAWSGPSAKMRDELERCQRLQRLWLGVSMRHLRWRSTSEVVTDDPAFADVAALGLPIYFHALKDGAAQALAEAGWGLYAA